MLHTIRRRIPLGFLGMLGLVAVAEALILHGVTPDLPTLDWRSARQAAARQARGCQVLAFGDSLVKLGLATPMLEETLGVRAYNLAVLGGQGPSHEALLRRAIAHGARPEVVLIDGEVLGFPPLLQTRLWLEMLPVGELVSLVRSAGDWRAATAMTLERLLPSVRLRDSARQAVRVAIERRRLDVAAIEARVYRRNWLANRGAQMTPVVPLAPEALAGIAGGRFEVDPVNLPYLERFLREAASIGATVVWLLPPVHPKTQAARDAAGYRQRASEILSRLQACHANLIVLDGQAASMPPDGLVDATHLNQEGACRYTAAVAGTLRKVLDGQTPATRWITLGDYPTVARASGIEDLTESLHVVAQPQRRRQRQRAVLAREDQGAGVSR